MTAAKELERLLLIKACEDRLYAIGQNSWSRPHTALEIASKLRRHSGVFWPFIMSAWSGFDLIPHEDFEDLFDIHRAKWSPKFMSDENLNVYNDLPETITIYRGQDRDHPIGLSWTLNLDVARFFGRGHRGMWNDHPVVLTGTVRKNDVAFVASDRDEQEIVVFSTSAVEILKASDEAASDPAHVTAD